MNDNVRKIFDILGVEPNEKFEVVGYGNTKFSITEDLILSSLDGVASLNLFRVLLLSPEQIIKIPKKKHVGDLKCEDVECKYCPLYSIHCFPNPDTLNYVLEKWLEVYGDKELYKILKARLDKEVE